MRDRLEERDVIDIDALLGGGGAIAAKLEFNPLWYQPRGGDGEAAHCFAIDCEGEFAGRVDIAPADFNIGPCVSQVLGSQYLLGTLSTIDPAIGLEQDINDAIG